MDPLYYFLPSGIDNDPNRPMSTYSFVNLSGSIASSVLGTIKIDLVLDLEFFRFSFQDFLNGRNIVEVKMGFT